jgi:hypothetical protein
VRGSSSPVGFLANAAVALRRRRPKVKSEEEGICQAVRGILSPIHSRLISFSAGPGNCCARKNGRSAGRVSYIRPLARMGATRILFLLISGH